MNTSADLSSGKLLVNIQPRMMNQNSIVYEPGPVYCNGIKISSALGYSLEQEICRQALDKYWIEKWFLSEEKFRKCDMQSLKQARLQSSMVKMTWVSKLMAGQLADHAVLYRPKLRFTSQCPLCLSSERGIRHRWACTHPKMVASQYSHIARMSTWLDDEAISPKVRMAIISRIQYW